MSLTDALLFIDGKQIKPSELPIIPLDGFNLSVFETMKSHKGKIIYLKEHLDRLFESAKTSGIKIQKTRENIEEELTRIMTGLSPRGPSPRNRPSFTLRLTVSSQLMLVVVSSRVYSKKIFQEGVNLKTSTVKRNHTNSVPPEAKSSELTNGLLGFLDLNSDQTFDRIYLGIDGYVREAGIWNFFMVKDSVLKTPPTAGILNGVIRRFVIKYALESAISVEETFFTRHDVFNADEAFLSNSIGEIVPVRSLDHRKIGPGSPGKITKQLMRRFESK